MDYDIFEVELLKYTGKVGISTPVNTICFKSIDTATFKDDQDAKNYPIHAPYSTNESYSYECWYKFKLKLKDEFAEFMNGSGIDIPYSTTDVNGQPIEAIKHYSTVGDLGLWFKINQVPSTVEIKFGKPVSYVRPVISQSVIATTPIDAYKNTEYSSLTTIPLTFASLSTLTIAEAINASSQFIVFQLKAIKGKTYQLANVNLCYSIHYTLT